MITPDEMRAHLVDRAAQDPEFRAFLLDDPKAAVKQELGFEIPSQYQVRILEDDGATAHLVLPPSSALDEAGLEAVVGGGERERDGYHGQSWNVHEW